ncbi:MAG: hypothetical protein N7Q72_05725, partial [Spiroplasma sp. Tabriz.8]|nr:hypothetical protein [Spiroplasma sp. Tabriz.8]
ILIQLIKQREEEETLAAWEITRKQTRESSAKTLYRDIYIYIYIYIIHIMPNDKIALEVLGPKPASLKVNFMSPTG